MGAIRRWQIETPEPHTIRVQVGIYSDRLLLYVDDRRVPVERVQGESHYDDLCGYRLEIDGQSCELSVCVNSCQLWIAGKLQPELESR